MTHDPSDALGAGALALAGAKRSDEFCRLLSGAINSTAQYEAKTTAFLGHYNSFGIRSRLAQTGWFGQNRDDNGDKQ